MDPKIEEARRAAEHAQGFLAEREGKLLYSLAKGCEGKGVIVEIGSWKGKSTIWLGKGSQAGQRVKIYAVDPHQGTPGHKRQGELWTFDEFKRNISTAGVADVVVPLVATSETAALDFRDPVELIFVDGDHEYESVKRDFELWFPKVIEGGVMAFHDTTGWEGPKRLVAESICGSRHFCDSSFVCSITFAKKTKENTVGQRLRGRWVLFAKNSSFLAKSWWEILGQNLRAAAQKLGLSNPIRSLRHKILPIRGRG